MKGVVFKLALNNGGTMHPGDFIGYRGPCSRDVVYENIKVRKHPNCSAANNKCRNWLESGFNDKARPVGRFACHEWQLLRKKGWSISPGGYHRGKKKGTPIPIKNATSGDIVFFSTIPPEGKQQDRIVFGLFRIGESPEGASGSALHSDGTMEIALPQKVASELNFWRYYSNRNGSRSWGSGPFRYLDELNTTVLLANILYLLDDQKERDILFRALGGTVFPKPLSRSPHQSGNGFSTHGESEEHRRLKEYVGTHPGAIGLPEQSSAYIEHTFASGDRVDIMFELPDGSAAVVEVETVVSFPTGAHQCIKYRALLEAQRGEPIGRGRVQAFLVAYQFGEDSVSFAKKYDIKLVSASLTDREIRCTILESRHRSFPAEAENL